ncbi:MAG: hypothetical protein U0231_12960 [Nitrospiraceae bacterium]
MPTLNQLVAEQVKIISGAKAALEAAQKQPPTTAATIATRESTIVDLKTRMADLAEAEGNDRGKDSTGKSRDTRPKSQPWRNKSKRIKSGPANSRAAPRLMKRKGRSSRSWVAIANGRHHRGVRTTLRR